MSDAPVKSSEFKRVVTFCAMGGSRHTVHNIGLLFVDADGPTTSEIERLMQSPVLQKFFEGPFFGTVVSWNANHYHSCWSYSSAPTLNEKDAKNNPLQRAILISTTLEDFPTPATEHDTCPIYLQLEGAVYRFTVGEVYDKCLQMQKFIDCSKCTVQKACISINLPTQRCIVEPPQLSLPGMPPPGLPEEVFVLNRDDWNDLKLKMWTSELEGYTAIPSIATAWDPVRPGAAMMRPFWQHHFDNLDKARDDLSSRADAGVKTRNTIRTQCANCYFGGKPYKSVHPCNKWAARRCDHGAWTEEMLVETTIDSYGRALKGTSFTLDDVWRVLFVAGEPFRKDRCLWVVNRFVAASRSPYDNATEGVGIGVVLSRVSRAARFGEEAVFSMDKLRTWLPEELRTRLDNPKPVDRHLLAVAIQLSVCRYGKGYSYFYNSRDSCGYGNHTPNVRHVRYNYDYIIQGVWGKSYEREHRFRSLQEVYNHYGRLPYFSIYDAQTTTQLVSWNS